MVSLESFLRMVGSIIEFEGRIGGKNHLEVESSERRLVGKANPTYCLRYWVYERGRPCGQVRSNLRDRIHRSKELHSKSIKSDR